MEFIKDALYRNRVTGYQRTLDSWGEKNVKLGLGWKLIAPMRMTREEFEREWELADPVPFHERG